MQSQFQQFMRQLKKEYWDDEQQAEQQYQLKPQPIQNKGKLKEMLRQLILKKENKKIENPLIKMFAKLKTEGQISEVRIKQIAEELNKSGIKQQQKYVVGQFLHKHFTYFLWYHIVCDKLKSMMSQNGKLKDFYEGLEYINGMINDENGNKKQPKTQMYHNNLENIGRVVKQYKNNQKQNNNVKNSQLQQVERMKKQMMSILDQTSKQNQNKLISQSQKQQQQLKDINTKLHQLKVKIQNLKLVKPNNAPKKQDKKFSVSPLVGIRVQPTIGHEKEDQHRNKKPNNAPKKQDKKFSVSPLVGIRVQPTIGHEKEDQHRNKKPNNAPKKQDKKFSVSPLVGIRVQPTIGHEKEDQRRKKFLKARIRIAQIFLKVKRQKQKQVQKMKGYWQEKEKDLKAYMKQVENKFQQLLKTKLKSYEDKNNKKYNIVEKPTDFFMWNLLAGYQIRAWQKSFEPHHRQGQYLTKIIQEYTKKKIVRTKLIYQYDEIVPLNFHTYVDDISDYVVIAKLQNQLLIGAYSHWALSKGVVNKGPGLVSSLTNQFTVYIEPKLPDYRTTAYNEYYIVFGNGEIRIQQSTREVSSCFGKQYMFYRPKSRPEIFLGEKQQPVKFKQLQVHKVVFEDQNQANNKTDGHTTSDV